MPYASTAQKIWMHINKPAMAKRWDRETPKGARLPVHVKTRKNTVKKGGK